MSKIVMPKNSADYDEILAVLKIYYEAGGWISNEEYKVKLKQMIGDDQYESSYTKKSQITSYFGFTQWEDISSPHSKRSITKLGKQFYAALIDSNKERINEILIYSLEKICFGRNNFACPESDSDIEAPNLFVRTCLELGYLTFLEFAYLLWVVEKKDGNYTDTVKEIKNKRENGEDIVLDSEAEQYKDCKPILMLIRWNFLDIDTNFSGQNKHIVINKDVLDKYRHRLKRLKIYNIDKDFDIDVNSTLSDKSDKPFNRILFGAPGTGKSDKLKKEVESFVSSTNYERVTFYPDYTYSQFVGAYKPITDGGEIKYKFVLGPFGRILKQAFINPSENFVLAIEEINRAKAPAVFGDVFQLLDREQNGESTYDIQISDEFKKELGIENNRIKLPSNLYIWATMNSADQGVFPLDSAFKRRWSFEYINVDNDKDKIADWTIKIKDQNYKWNDLRYAINNVLSTNFGVSEDKLLGTFFLKQSELNEESFKSKVLMYLFEDVVRTRRSDFFNVEQYNKFSAVCDKFDDQGLAVLKDKTICDLVESSTSNNSVEAPAETEA